ncbi:DUF1772 domain-containing protein [Tamaricihabitans halophyticus]|nr:DUF1772 domain-containing protein [Tamaricihabitans halophyticus]
MLIPVVLLCNGLAAGVLMGTLLGGWPLLDTLSATDYVHAHAFFSTRYDPFMPICLVVTVVVDGTLVFANLGTVSSALFAVAGLLAAATVIISLTKNVPVNRWVRTLDPARLPDDFDERDPRRHWGVWNRARATFTTAALLANCVALGLVL